MWIDRMCVEMSGVGTTDNLNPLIRLGVDNLPLAFPALEIENRRPAGHLHLLVPLPQLPVPAALGERVVHEVEVGQGVEVEEGVVGLELPHEGLGRGIVDGEDSGGLDRRMGTSRMEKPYLTTLRRKASFVLIGIFAYFDLTPTCLRFLWNILKTIIINGDQHRLMAQDGRDRQIAQGEGGKEDKERRDCSPKADNSFICFFSLYVLALKFYALILRPDCFPNPHLIACFPAEKTEKGGCWVGYNIMQSEEPSIDGNPVWRYLHLHCFTHIYRVLAAPPDRVPFSKPRFPLFRRIERLYHSKEKNQLFFNLIFTYCRELAVALTVTLIFASLNLLVPELIRQFMHFMREKHLERREYGDFIGKFVVIQFLRIFFGEHSKRLFHELALKVESTLARKLVSKSLRMAKESRDRIPESQIIQLQNVDLKLVFALFRNMNIIFEAPFTIVVAIILLFNESSHYGFIGVYWFLIAFLLQRELDGRMMHCNQTKLGLIERRSNLNYDLFDKMREAKLIGWEGLLTEKNNNLFIEENHDHALFYSFATLYDITLLMLPIFVVSTITLYDVNEEDPITVEQVYLMLSLLGICYNPMKNVRTISISLHDGMHSLRRISRYFHFPEEIKTTLIENTQGLLGELLIQEGTVATYPHSSSNFDVKMMEFSVGVQPGERLTLIGKKQSGCSSFLEMLVGNLKRVRGKIYMRGKVSYLPQKHFFLKDTVKQNIRFFNEALATPDLEQLYNELGLSEDLRFEQDLQTIMDDTNKFTRTVLKKIALARVLLSEADFYILDSPFNDIDDSFGQVIERRLRELQGRGKTIVLSLKHLDKYTALEDHIVILEEGQVKQYGHFTELLNCYESSIRFFCVSLRDGQEIQEPRTGAVEQRFQERAKSMINFDIKSVVPSKRSNTIRQRRAFPSRGGLKLREQLRERIPASDNFQHLVMKFLSAVSFKQTVYLLFIILAAEVLHIFIHFYIGHLEEQYGNDDYTKYKSLMISEVILTFCLAGLIFLEGEISTILAVAIGNRLYEESFDQLGRKGLAWYAQELSVKLADKYNHDYEQIFMACHSLLGIYKNMVVLIATIEFISTNRSKLIAIFVVLASIYYSIFYLYRKVERKVVKHYYDYKYNYVRSLEESIQGAELFNICGLKQEVLKRAEGKYEELASYKLAESYTGYGLSLICDMLSISLLTLGIEYGIEMKIHHREQRISVVATSIFLLMNISEVLKTIIREMLAFETFFSINLVPFMEIGDSPRLLDDEGEELRSISAISAPSFDGHRLEFHNLLIEEPGEVMSKSSPFSLTVQQGEVVLLYQKDNRLRDLLLYALTKNLPMFTDRTHFKSRSSTIRLGGVDIREVSRKEWHAQIGLIASENFYFIGTVRENISWAMENYNDLKALNFAKQLQLEREFAAPEANLLSTRLTAEMKRIKGGLMKKIALLRILLRRPRVVILKDTDEYIDAISIIELLKQEIPSVTILKITNFLQASLDVDRVVAMENLEIIEDGVPDDIKQYSKTKFADLLRDVNYESYNYRKKVNSDKRSDSLLNNRMY